MCFIIKEISLRISIIFLDKSPIVHFALNLAKNTKLKVLGNLKEGSTQSTRSIGGKKMKMRSYKQVLT